MCDSVIAPPGLVVRRAGMATIQDLGRRGWSRAGMPVNGAADQYSAMAANVLVGNAEAAPLIEITLLDVVLVATGDALISVTGAPAEMTVNAAAHPQWSPIRLFAGDTVAIKKIKTGLRCYLAVHGGVVADRLVGSAAPDSVLGFGHRLTTGETLPIADHDPAALPDPADLDSCVLTLPVPVFTAHTVIDVTDGPDAAEFTDGFAVLEATAYTVTAQSNHVGLRLAGAVPQRPTSGEVLSRGVPVGAVEVPSADQLLVLHRGRGVTAGYPVLAVVTTDSLDALGQARPGHTISFRRRTVADAVAVHRLRRSALTHQASQLVSVLPPRKGESSKASQAPALHPFS